MRHPLATLFAWTFLAAAAGLVASRWEHDRRMDRLAWRPPTTDRPAWPTEGGTIWFSGVNCYVTQGSSSSSTTVTFTYPSSDCLTMSVAP